MRSNLALGIGVVAALAGLAGCAKIRYPNYYLLNVPAPSPAGHTASLLGPVAVRHFASPAFLREGPIVYRESPERLAFYNYDRWAVDPRRAATNAMVNEMRSRGVFQSVDLYDGSPACDWIVSGTLDHLEEVDEGAEVWIEVGLSARLKSVPTGEVLWQDTSTKRVKVDKRSVPGVVAGMSRELGIAVEALVTSMVNRLATSATAQSFFHQ
ncbi:MAG TPA: ABC-type transport auxiliary lipoprotein family protein [Opitutaceae bacterium]|nr:ABC-type transport auxiliary lipoprotein family protein [Opitutaceae bacterium]